MAVHDLPDVDVARVGLYQAMSSVPRLKSPMPAGVQPASTNVEAGIPMAVHDLPDVDVARRGIVPGDIVGAVVIEVANAERRPAGVRSSDAAPSGRDFPEIEWPSRDCTRARRCAVEVEIRDSGDLIAKRMRTDVDAAGPLAVESFQRSTLPVDGLCQSSRWSRRRSDRHSPQAASLMDADRHRRCPPIGRWRSSTDRSILGRLRRGCTRRRRSCRRR